MNHHRSHLRRMSCEMTMLLFKAKSFGYRKSSGKECRSLRHLRRSLHPGGLAGRIRGTRPRSPGH
ncbi:hypothetical protein KSP39_PZI013594 [Platanthera zijinensis]|uniref:Uncharacterized protein n=1 Tax=Platanthera zijinensis TaxID=2320716 RepID=A0AAP0G3N2_9ASPA